MIVPSRRRITTWIAGLAAVVAATLTGASPASAYDYCSDSIKYGGEVIAKICINIGSGVNDSIYLVSYGSHAGKAKKMSFKVCRYAGGGPYTCASDTGTYKYYAGPISTYMCRRYYVKIWKPGDSSKLLVDRTITETCN